MLCAEPKEHKRFRPGTRPGGIGFPAGRIGDRGDREIVYVPNIYVPFPALTGEGVGAKKSGMSFETQGNQTRAHTKGVVQQRPLLRRVLRRLLETAFEKVLRRVLRRCLAVCFIRRKGSEKGS